VLIEEEIRKEIDQLQQPGRDVRGEDADDDRQSPYREDAGGGGEVAEVIERIALNGLD